MIHKELFLVTCRRGADLEQCQATMRANELFSVSPPSVKNRGSCRNGAALAPEIGMFARPSPFFKNV